MGSGATRSAGEGGEQAERAGIAADCVDVEAETGSGATQSGETARTGPEECLGDGEEGPGERRGEGEEGRGGAGRGRARGRAQLFSSQRVCQATPRSSSIWRTKGSEMPTTLWGSPLMRLTNGPPKPSMVNPPATR